MKNIKLELEYDGTRYKGWQRMGKDESSMTISNKLVEVLKKMSEEEATLFCGARTEVGVHAKKQVVSFKTNTTLSLVEIKNYLNRYLPMDIAIRSIQEMPERFHAALNAKEKVYAYRLDIGSVPNVFVRRFAFYPFQPPSIDLMEEAIPLLVGERDFKNFSGAKKNKSTIRNLKSIEIIKKEGELHILLRADDFLHNMARNIISTLLEIGTKKRKKEEITEIFNGTKEASPSCDPKGLFLLDIIY